MLYTQIAFITTLVGLSERERVRERDRRPPPTNAKPLVVVMNDRRSRREATSDVGAVDMPNKT